MSRRKPLGLIWSQSDNGVIGLNGVMPWHLPEDLERFRELTLGTAVILGRKTWDSLPYRKRPLPGRRNIVVTRQTDWNEAGAEAVGSIEAAMELAQSGPEPRIWAIGGGEILGALIDKADVIEVTYVRGACVGDTFAPLVGAEWSLTASSPLRGWHTSRKGSEYLFATFATTRRASK